MPCFNFSASYWFTNLNLVMLWEGRRFLIFLSFGGDGLISLLRHL